MALEWEKGREGALYAETEDGLEFEVRPEYVARESGPDGEDYDGCVWCTDPCDDRDTALGVLASSIAAGEVDFEGEPAFASKGPGLEVAVDGAGRAVAIECAWKATGPDGEYLEYHATPEEAMEACEEAARYWE